MKKLLVSFAWTSKVLLGCLLILGSVIPSADLFAQASVPKETQELVSNQVVNELESWQSSEQFNDLLASHPQVSGFLTLEISIYKKGHVRSIFQVESNIENVPLRNAIKNHIKEHKFDLKKMDKKTTQKVRYTFHINE